MNEQLSSIEGRFLAHLPAIYQEQDPPDLLGSFLAAFERVLLGEDESRRRSRKPASKRDRRAPSVEGLGKKIARLYKLFDPRDTPEEFLPWLASWAALTLRANLSTAKQRNLIAHIIPLYRIRGTR